MTFNKIVCVDKTKLQDWAIEELQQLSKGEVATYNDYPESNEEVLKRIGDAEAVFVSWHTQLDEEIISRCPNLKYIGMCCSLYDDESANVAVTYAREQGIAVTGIRDYGDPGVVEFITAALVRLLHGLGDQQWKDMPVELTNKKIGIVGLGTTGQLLAKCLLPFGMDLYYFSRTRKKEWEEKGVTYLPLEELLEKVAIISLHLPKNTVVLKEREFNLFGPGKILINTSLGLPFDENAFSNWIKDPSSFAIFDGDGKESLQKDIENNKNIITANKSAGWSAETHRRLSEKVIENVQDFVSKS